MRIIICLIIALSFISCDQQRDHAGPEVPPVVPEPGIGDYEFFDQGGVQAVVVDGVGRLRRLGTSFQLTSKSGWITAVISDDPTLSESVMLIYQGESSYPNTIWADEDRDGYLDTVIMTPEIGAAKKMKINLVEVEIEE